jgi:hypothetical protein
VIKKLLRIEITLQPASDRLEEKKKTPILTPVTKSPTKLTSQCDSTAPKNTTKKKHPPSHSSRTDNPPPSSSPAHSHSSTAQAASSHHHRLHPPLPRSPPPTRPSSARRRWGSAPRRRGARTRARARGCHHCRSTTGTGNGSGNGYGTQGATQGALRAPGTASARARTGATWRATARRGRARRSMSVWARVCIGIGGGKGQRYAVLWNEIIGKLEKGAAERMAHDHRPVNGHTKITWRPK